MRIIYTPEGGSKREWDVDLANPAWDVMSQTEKITDWPWDDFRDRLGRQSGIALQALLYVLRKREEPKLALASVTPDMDELDFDVQCPRCKDWLGDDPQAHECPDADEPEGEEKGEA